MQVTLDVANAIGASYSKGVLHRDITPNNFGWHEVDGIKRGVLFDYGAGKVCAAVMLKYRNHTRIIPLTCQAADRGPVAC